MKAIDERLFKQWVAGLFIEEAFKGESLTDKMNLENAQKAIKFADEVVGFIKKHKVDLLK